MQLLAGSEWAIKQGSNSYIPHNISKSGNEAKVVWKKLAFEMGWIALWTQTHVPDDINMIRLLHIPTFRGIVDTQSHQVFGIVWSLFHPVAKRFTPCWFAWAGAATQGRVTNAHTKPITKAAMGRWLGKKINWMNGTGGGLHPCKHATIIWTCEVTEKFKLSLLIHEQTRWKAHKSQKIY